jgi:hypothetical protein
LATLQEFAPIFFNFSLGENFILKVMAAAEAVKAN